MGEKKGGELGRVGPSQCLGQIDTTGLLSVVQVCDNRHIL